MHPPVITFTLAVLLQQEDPASREVAHDASIWLDRNDQLIDVRTASGLLLHARTPGKPTPGENVQLTVPPERVLLYPRAGEP